MVQDMTTGRPFKLLLAFAIPLFIGNVFQLCYVVTDAAIVGRMLGADSLAAIGLTGALLDLSIVLFSGLTNGLSIITSQRFGAGDYDGVRHSVAMSTYITAFSTLLCTVIFILGMDRMLSCLHTPADIYPQARQYLIILFGFTFTMVLYMMLFSILRALGDSTTPLYFLLVSYLANIGLDLWFISGLGWGIRGAAIATVLSQALSGILCLVLILWKFPILRMSRRDWRWDWPFIWEHLRIAVPMALQFSIISIGLIVVQYKLSEFGVAAIASYAVLTRLDMLVFLPGISIGVAVGTFAAQNYGAGKYNRISQGLDTALRMELYSALAIGLIFFWFGNYFIRLFLKNPSEEITTYVRLYILTAAGLYWVVAVLQVYRYALQGIGHTVAPMFSGFIEIFIRISVVLILPTHLGFWGICLANPLAWIGSTVQLGIVYYIVIHQLRHKLGKSTDSLTSVPSDNFPA